MTTPTYPFRRSWWRHYGTRKGPTLALMLHMAEGGGTVGFLDDQGTAPPRGVSVHAVVEFSGRVVQMLDWTDASGSLNPADRSSDKPYYSRRILEDVLGSWWSDPNSATISAEIEGHAAAGPNALQVAGAIAWGRDMAHRFPAIRGALGHADQTDTKGCPGASSSMREIFDKLGGHGLWVPDVLVVSDPTPKLATIHAGAQLRTLAGAPIAAAPSPAVTVPSPFGTIVRSGHYRAVVLTTHGIRQLLLVHAVTTDVTLADPPAPPVPHVDLTHARALAAELHTELDAIRG